MSNGLLKILLVEDNEDDYIAVRDMLAMVQKPQFEVVWLESYEKAVSSLIGQQANPQTAIASYDACLIDYRLGEHNGLELLQQALSLGHQPPIILLTGVGGRDIDLQALEMGATGFLAKDEISPTNLERTIRYAIRQKQTEASLHQSQETLAQSNAALERKFVEQSAALERALKQADYLRQLQTRLLSSVSHEFRTPLSYIQSSAELMKDFPADEATQAHRLQQIYAGVDRITKTLDDTILYAELAAGAIPFNPAPLDLKPVCETLITDLRSFLDPQQKLQLINHHCPSDLVYIDITLLQLMLTHLTLNAIRYAPNSGNINLELDCKEQGPGSWDVTFQVKDQGIGIPLDEQKNVFSAYYRARNADAIPGTPGIGIGLAIVKQAAALHQGVVYLSSEVGQGTTVTLSLLAVKAAV